MHRTITRIALWASLFSVSLAVCHKTQAQFVFYKPANQLDAAVQTALSFEIASLRLEAEAWDEDARIQRKSAGVLDATRALLPLSSALNPNLAGVNANTARSSASQSAGLKLSAEEMEEKAEEKRRLWAEGRTTVMRLRGMATCEENESTFWLLSAESDRVAIEARVKSGEGRKKRHRKEWWGRVAIMRDKTTTYWKNAATLCSR